MLLEQLLPEKGRDAVTLSIDQTVETAIQVMNKKKISALVVVNGEQPVGIFCERDVLRCHLGGTQKPLSAIRLVDAMDHRRFIMAKSDDEVYDALGMMVNADLEYLPVTKMSKLIGMLTIRDLAFQQIDSLKSEIDYLQDYINDLQDAVQD